MLYLKDFEHSVVDLISRFEAGLHLVSDLI